MAGLAAVAGIVAGLLTLGGGLYAHHAQPSFGAPGFFALHGDWLSGVYVLLGLGTIMVAGGLLSFKWPSVGAVVVCSAAMVGLIHTYGRGQYHWLPYLYYWGGPWVFAWLAGILAGYAAYRNVPQIDEELSDAREGSANETW